MDVPGCDPVIKGGKEGRGVDGNLREIDRFKGGENIVVTTSNSPPANIFP